MTYTRVLVFETHLSRTAVMKNTSIAEVILRKHKKEKLLNGYKLIGAGDRWVLITNFNTKTKAKNMYRLWPTHLEPKLTKQMAKCRPIKARLKKVVNPYQNTVSTSF